MRLTKAALLFTLATAAVWAQVNAGEQKPEASLPFTMTTVSTFELPWRIAFLPDGRMLVTEKIRPIWLVSKDGQKIAHSEAGLAAGSGDAGDLLGAGDRAGQFDVLYRHADVPVMERQRLHQRHGDYVA